MNPLIVRTAHGIATALVGIGLGMHVAMWFQTGRIAWPMVAVTLGLLVITLTGVIDPPRGKLRVALLVIALALIVPGSVLVVLH